MGLQVVMMFIDSFMDDVNYVRDTEVCVYSMICVCDHVTRLGKWR